MRYSQTQTHLEASVAYATWRLSESTYYRTYFCEVASVTKDSAWRSASIYECLLVVSYQATLLSTLSSSYLLHVLLCHSLLPLPSLLVSWFQVARNLPAQ